MADNVVANPGAGGATFATDDIGGVQHPYTKVEWGPADTANIVDDASGKRFPVNVSESALVGAVNETAPATDTASSGLNGRLQRIAQRLTSLIALLPASLGQKAMAASLAVVVASDQSAIPVSDGGSSITVDGTVSISGAVSVTGTVTANAGTNLNTSALALEAGGNLAAAATSLAIMDDWDETDRAKVNPIVGQAGVAAGAGAVGATVQRTTLASDDPAVVSLAVMDDWDESDRAKVNPIAGQAGVQGGSGTVNALTQRVVLATDVGLPAGTAAIGTVTDGGSGKTLKRAVVAKTSDGDIVALVASKKIKVFAYEIQSQTDGMTAQIKSNNAAGTALTIPWVFNAREGVCAVAVHPPNYLFATAAGEALFADITGTGTLNFAVSYWDDDAT